MTSTSAPPSCNNAADSSALWPAPITTSCWPANRLRSRCSDECQASEGGRPSNSGGRTDADSDNDTARPDHVAICKDDSEARRTGFDAGNLPLIAVGYRLALI